MNNLLCKELIEKRANLPMGKFFGTAWLRTKHRGFRNTLDWMRKFRDPSHNLPLGKNNVPSNIYTHSSQKGKANLSRGVRTSFGNMADNASILIQNTEGKGVIKGTGQVLKNFGELTARQIKGDRFREITGPLVKKDGKEYIMSRSPFLKDREVVSRTGRDSYIVKKRKVMQPVGVALGGSGLSIGAASYVLGDKEKPTSERLQTAAKDTVLYTAGIPIGIAGTLALENNKQRKKKNKNNNIKGE